MSWSARGGEPASSWAELERCADGIRDHAGTPIDAGIRPVVVGLWAHGISTDFSCEGHLHNPDPDPASGFVPPSVSVCAPPPDPHPLQVDPDLARADPALADAARAWRIANYAQVRALFALLERFSADRAVPFHVRLQVSMNFGDWGRAELHSAGGFVTRAMPRAEQAARLALYQAEMAAFATFLREMAGLR